MRLILHMMRDFAGGLLVSFGIRMLPSGRGKLNLAYAWVEYCKKSRDEFQRKRAEHADLAQN